ncbi:MAG: Flp pilus assembly complex ATPase component TadA [Deltaproteobacteria bacterium]|nr:Flp pilus assembly complex ATPase component TadA [Deltaproteobacteria bacterium]
MFEIVINEKGGSSRTESFEKSEVTIGRVQGNDVILPKGNISKRHSRIVLKDGKFIIVDLKSTNGTYVNGKKITAPQVIKGSDKIYIGDFTLQLTSANGAASGVSMSGVSMSGASMSGASLGPASGADASKGDGAPREREQRAGLDDELDLFGGGDSGRGESGAVAKPAASPPGLIDDNFDQEFDAAEPAPRMPEPSRSRGRMVELEPSARSSPDLELGGDEDFGDDGFGALGGGREIDLEPPPEPEREPEPEPTPAPAPVKLPRNAASKVAQRARPSQATPPPARKSSLDFSLPPDDDEAQDDDAPGPALIPDPPALAGAGPASASRARALPGSPRPLSAGASPVMASPVVAAPLPVLGRQESIELVRRAIIDELDLASLPLSTLERYRDSATDIAQLSIQGLVASGRLAADGVSVLLEDAVASAIDLGPLASLVADDSIVEISVGADREIWVDREGQIEPAGVRFESEAEVRRLVAMLGALAGRVLDREHPLLDARLRDGSRVIASLPPLSFRGPAITLRKSARDAFTLERLVEYGTISSAMAQFLGYCLRYRRGILLSAGPGVNASATMNALAVELPPEDRIVTIESGVELDLQPLKNVVSFELGDGVGFEQLVRHATALQADRLLVGNLSGPGVWDVLRAMAGPLEGSIAACSARTPSEALDRIVRLEMTASPDAQLYALRLLSLACPIVVQERRFADQSRRITSIGEMTLSEDLQIGVEEIFKFVPEGVDGQGIVAGSFTATGCHPRFLEELVDRGEAADVDMSIFTA